MIQHAQHAAFASHPEEAECMPEAKECDVSNKNITTRRIKIRLMPERGRFMGIYLILLRLMIIYRLFAHESMILLSLGDEFRYCRLEVQILSGVSLYSKG